MMAACLLFAAWPLEPLKAADQADVALAPLIEELKAGNADLRRSAAMADVLQYPELFDPAVTVLTELLRDSDPGVGEGAAEALGLIGAAAAPALPELENIIASEPGGPFRQAAVMARTRIKIGAERALYDIRLADGLLTVRAADADLDAVLKAISDEARIAVIVDESLGDRRISGDISGVSLSEGLRLLLADYDVFNYHRGGTGLLTVWVYDKMDGRGLFPVPPTMWASTAELEKQLDDYDPEARIAALENIVARNPADAGRHLMKALNDLDDQVRSNALMTALDEGVALPEELLSNLAVSDRSHGVRFMALKRLWSDPSMEWAAEDAMEQALTDPNPVIRSYAERMLNSLYPPPEAEGASQQAQNTKQ
jgi:type II secretory pathway component GspD/PulD (secretin)